VAQLKATWPADVARAAPPAPTLVAYGWSSLDGDALVTCTLCSRTVDVGATRGALDVADAHWWFCPFRDPALGWAHARQQLMVASPTDAAIAPLVADPKVRTPAQAPSSRARA
jgi:hypothetical protein